MVAQARYSSAMCQMVNIPMCRERERERERNYFTVPVCRMSHRKWRETKQQQSRARSGHQLSCCLVSLGFLCDILRTSRVLSQAEKAVIRWEEARQVDEGGGGGWLSYLQDNKIVSHVSKIELEGKSGRRVR